MKHEVTVPTSDCPELMSFLEGFKPRKPIINDRRTEAEKLSHRFLVIGTDRFLSGWGEAKNRTSYAAWACTPETYRTVLDWVESRTDMLRVRWVYEPPGALRYRPRSHVHLSIYVVNPGHPSLG